MSANTVQQTNTLTHVWITIIFFITVNAKMEPVKIVLCRMNVDTMEPRFNEVLDIMSNILRHGQSLSGKMYGTDP